MLYRIACGTRGWVYISSHGVGYDIPSLSARYCVTFGRSASTFSAPPPPPPPPPCVSVVSLSVSPDDGSGPEEVPGRWRLDLFLLNIGQFYGVLCVLVLSWL